MGFNLTFLPGRVEIKKLRDSMKGKTGIVVTKDDDRMSSQFSERIAQADPNP